MKRALLLLAPAILAAQGLRVEPFAQEVRTVHLAGEDVLHVAVGSDGAVVAATRRALARWRNGAWTNETSSFARRAPAVTGPGAPQDTRQLATARDGRQAAAAGNGLFLKGPSGKWEREYPRSGRRSWSPDDVRGVAFDAQDRLWFASPQGVGVLERGQWTLYTGADGLPYDDFTTVAAGERGVVWFGTHAGAIRFDGKTWEYRQGPRWLPDDDVRSIAVAANGDAWIATAKGLSRIERRQTTLAEKARVFEAEIDKRHRRTPYGYVLEVRLKNPGDVSEWTQHDSDNDGLWTSMYGAGECFAYAATKSADARRRAVAAFEALRFLGTVTQGGRHSPPRGFVARSILPADGPDPNRNDSPERDVRMRETRDRLWKSIAPRWPLSGDGKWYWKADTSSDELDGHYFFYGVYYDLVAQSEAEKRAVREHVAALTDHLVDHNFQLIDHDGKPTRWGIFDPANLNHNVDFWGERGINSLSMLAYLKIAGHITGDAKYERAYRKLIDEHAYEMNVLIPKSNAGPGAGNQSDDEMIFMNYYGLLRYEKDPALRRRYLLAFHNHWKMEQPEINPLFDFFYAATARGETYTDAFDRIDLTPQGAWLEDTVDTLRRFPLDRVQWGFRNSHRKDIVPLPTYAREAGLPVGSRVNGKVLPVDERYVGHWNHDPWRLDQPADGRTLGDGAAYLLPYYLGLYTGLIRE
jgi:hypothetical protein